MTGRHNSTIIFLGLAAVVCGILGGAATVQWQQRESVLAETNKTAQNLAAAIEAQVRGNIDAVDIALAGLVHVLPLLPAVQQPGDDSIHALLRTNLAGLPFVRALFINDATGDMVHDTDRLPQKFNSAARGYFIAQRDNPALGLFLGPPIVNAQGVWFISASRRINRPDGSFAGVVVAAIDLHKFETFFASIATGKTGSVSLMTPDNVLIARVPPAPALIGTVVGNSATQHQVLAPGKPGSATASSTVDGVVRSFALRRLPNRPLVVMVGLGQDEALAPWRSSTLAFVAASLALSALIAALAYLVWRELSRGRALNLGLQDARQKADATAHELAAVLDAIPDLMFELGLDGRIHGYRTQRHDLLSAPPEVFLGKLMSEVLPPAAATICTTALQEAHSQGFSTGMQYELEIGTERKWFEASVAPKAVVNGQGPRFVFLSRDITARHLAEAALRNSTAQLRLLESAVANLNDIVLITEAEPFDEPGNRIVFVNDAFVRRTGYSREEAIGRTPRMLQGAKTQAAELRRIGTALRKWEPVRAELINYTKSGEEFWLELDIVPVADDTGWFTHWVAVERDISERKSTEMTLLATNNELARSNAELAQFAFVASHDLQEPLRAVSSCVQLLKKRYAGQLDARADEFIAHAVGGSLRMQAMIDDLLLLSRVNATPRVHSVIDSAAAMEAACANLSGAIAQSGAQITHDALPQVQADPGQLAQLLQNLIGNALKFRGPQAAVVHVGARRDGAEWVFSVADQGIGIEPQYFGRIFELFRRLHTRDEYAGTGIGLAICKKIVERHGGRIWVESEPASAPGATFYFTLPATDPSTTSASPVSTESGA